MTPRLPDRANGLTTHGNRRWRSARRIVVDRGATNHGTGRPAVSKCSRVSSLLRAHSRGRARMARQARAPSSHRRQSPSADRRQRSRRRTESVAQPRESWRPIRLRRGTGSAMAASCQGSSSMWQRSVAKTRSTPSRSAASPNARVWYPVVVARRRTRIGCRLRLSLRP